MMKSQISRRKFLQGSSVAGTAALLSGFRLNDAEDNQSIILNKNPLKVGLMTYLLGKDWDIDTIIKNCTASGFLSVELRTTHAHGVEVALTPAQRAEVKKRFKDSPLETISLASAFQYHFPDRAELKRNIVGTKEYVLLAKDVGATGIRVFPNAFPEGVSKEKTMEQIGRSLAEVSEFGRNHGVEIRVCVHGQGTNSVSVIKKIIDYAHSPYVYVNWNCDPSDPEGAGLESNFNSVKDRIRGVHMHDLHDPEYPYRHLFKLLSESGFKGYCNAEIDRVSCEPVEYMKCYKGLFLALQNAI
jgi:sugar phosphate isomerase/epimerase